MGLITLEHAETGKTITLDAGSRSARGLYRPLNEPAIEECREQFRANRIDLIGIRTGDSCVEPLIRFFYQRAGIVLG